MKDFDERLHARLAKLDSAVPARRGDSLASSSRLNPNHRHSVASRLPVGSIAVFVLVIVGVVAASAYLRQSPMPWSGGAGPTASTGLTASSSPGVVFGADGFPSQIGTEPVFQLNEHAVWQNSNGSFLLVANPSVDMRGCLPAMRGGSAETDLVGSACGGLSLGSFTDSSAAVTVVYAAPKTSPSALLYGWVGHSVVLRVHTHDPEAEQCQAADQAACQAAVVVEAVVWPPVPSQINGEHVYRGSELRAMLETASTPTLKGDFLLGGVVTLASNAQQSPVCLANSAEQQLLAGCGETRRAVDMVMIAPKSTPLAADGQVVVVTAHFNDSLAANCSSDSEVMCREAVVVDAVVWSSDPYPTVAPIQIVFPTETPVTSGG